ncbi:sugar transferase [Leuconostoc pseudomesenteroides]|uniref:sugar transferase n=1 Tax=Leuconostoc pseudomesenteroides TaxID=33968 RepID=UPI0021A270A7|nr:sugar transferase [Leuconostoc pseudomesenteroides]MCT4380931.1 beta-1,6-galactofuranosyltransferase [Leuconostoc pseudomesenteroides]
MTYFITHTIEPWMPLGALKAKADYAQIAQAQGWTIVPIARYNDVRFDDETRQNHIKNWLNTVKADDTVIHQFPSYMSCHFEQQWVQEINKRSARSIVLIHDIEPLRLVKTDAWELSVLKQYNTIIVHSEAKANALKHMGVNSTFIIQPLFDYLGEVHNLASYSHLINFAGTFQKSPWLKDYDGPEINLFGSVPKKWRDFVFPNQVSYQGNFDPDDILNQLTSGFGLIWDNDFEDKAYQSYTKYNAPHKASLYLRAGLPLIAWQQSALAAIIKQYDIGLTINKLTDLKKIDDISLDQYQTWQKNIYPIASQLAQGFFTKQTLMTIQNKSFNQKFD